MHVRRAQEANFSLIAQNLETVHTSDIVMALSSLWLTLGS